MKQDIHLVLDTAAIKSYMRQEMAVRRVLAEQPGGVQCVALPVLCLAEAYRAATVEQAHLLKMLYRHPATAVTPIKDDQAQVLGEWSRILDSHDLPTRHLMRQSIVPPS